MKDYIQQIKISSIISLVQISRSAVNRKTGFQAAEMRIREREPMSIISRIKHSRGLLALLVFALSLFVYHYLAFDTAQTVDQALIFFFATFLCFAGTTATFFPLNLNARGTDNVKNFDKAIFVVSRKVPSHKK